MAATTFDRRRAASAGAIVALAAGVLLLAPPAKPEAAPLVSLGPVSLVRKPALGKRLFMVTVAQTARAKAQKTTW